MSVIFNLFNFRINRFFLFTFVIVYSNLFAESEFIVPTPQGRDDLVILTPPPGPEPRINGAKIYGCRPGRPFLYRIPCTGQRPIQFEARGLPDTLVLDQSTGIIRGVAPDRKGEYLVHLSARNSLGFSQRKFKIVVGSKLSLTPSMGWNHWYTHYHKITSGHIERAARSMIETGMADFGYKYVNLDDCWMRLNPERMTPRVRAYMDEEVLQLIVGETRDEQGRILSNAAFPDMKGLADYVHSKGLKIGIYSSPGPTTCQSYEGSWGYEEEDAAQFAEWGFDFLKYDLCSLRKTMDMGDRDAMIMVYQVMGDILKDAKRDIVYNICQYGNHNVWEWGPLVNGQSWRSTDDLGLEADTRLPAFYTIGLKNARLHEYAQPGHWNDPDYLLLGFHGIVHKRNDDPKYCSLTGDEQYSYMSMWALMNAPLFYSGDITRMDRFTLNILCNAEVIDLNQDTLGKQASILREVEDEHIVFVKPLEDGSRALGLFNLSEDEQRIQVTWDELKIEGKFTVRDLWRQKDLGQFEKSFSAAVPRHGVSLVRLK